MWLGDEAVRWVLLAALIAGVVIASRSYLVRDGRRQNLLLASVRAGCIGALLVNLTLVIVMTAYLWLTGQF